MRPPPAMRHPFGIILVTLMYAVTTIASHFWLNVMWGSGARGKCIEETGGLACAKSLGVAVPLTDHFALLFPTNSFFTSNYPPQFEGRGQH